MPRRVDDLRSKTHSPPQPRQAIRRPSGDHGSSLNQPFPDFAINPCPAPGAVGADDDYARVRVVRRSGYRPATISARGHGFRS